MGSKKCVEQITHLALLRSEICREWQFRYLFHRAARLSSAHGHLVGVASPIAKHHPTMVECNPTGRCNPTVRVPPLKLHNIVDEHNHSDIGEWSQDVVEWLGLLALDSTRVQNHDSVDPHLCRWTFPADTPDYATPIRVLRWEGFADPRWVAQLLITCM